MKPHLTAKLISMHTRLQSVSGRNAHTLRIPVPSALNIPEWRSRLRNYSYPDLCDFLEFGWPVGYVAPNPPVSSHQNHGSALSSPQTINSFLDTECHLGTTCGPFAANPLCVDLVTSALQIAHSHSGKPCVILDLSFPPGSSVNNGIPSDSYLGKPFVLCLPGIDALTGIIRCKGRGCHLFKKDFSCAYRQLRIDPCNPHLLGFRHNDHPYIDIAPPFGLRSSALICQRTTNAVSYMYHTLGYSCTNYIDDFREADTPGLSTQAFIALGDLFTSLGLQSSPDKDCLPTTSMVFLGVQLDTLAMSSPVAYISVLKEICLLT